jgi:hypothetical protein
LRPKNSDSPILIVKWANDNREYVIRDSHIEEYPLFVVYNEEHFNSHLLPKEEIPYRYEQNKTVSGAILSDLIEQLVHEIKSCKKKFTHFKMIQDKDFNHRKAAGLIVLRFKNYPFIVKLFIETPESFVNPWCKGILPIWFFYMGGCGNRHMTGLTRIKNLECIKNRLQADPQWSDLIDTPRKWFWTPKKQDWVMLTGYNIGGKKEISASIPGIYAIVADQIIATEDGTNFDNHRKKIALDLCNHLNMFIDPHLDNFFLEEGTGKIVIIDTEHFPTLVGLKEKISFTSYIDWYLGLSKKALHDIYFRLKSERKQAQITWSELNLFSSAIK